MTNKKARNAYVCIRTYQYSNTKKSVKNILNTDPPDNQVMQRKM